MIEWIEFKNFKALRDAKLPLSRFTLIVGANGSGKSTGLLGILALGRPNHWHSDAIRTAGIPKGELVALGAKWHEKANDYLINVLWNPGHNAPMFTPEAGNQLRNQNHVKVALQRARIFSLYAGAIAAPVEYGQRFIGGRFPDVTDVGLSVAGAWLGMWIATRGWLLFNEQLALLRPRRTVIGAPVRAVK